MSNFCDIRTFVVCLNATPNPTVSNIELTKSDTEITHQKKKTHFSILLSTSIIDDKKSISNNKSMETRGALKRKVSRGRKKRVSNRQAETMDDHETGSRSVAGKTESEEKKKSHTFFLYEDESIYLFYCCSQSDETGSHNMDIVPVVSPKVENENDSRHVEGMDCDKAKESICFFFFGYEKFINIHNEFRCVCLIAGGYNDDTDMAAIENTAVPKNESEDTDVFSDYFSRKY